MKIKGTINSSYQAGFEDAKAIFERPTGEWIMNKTSRLGRNYTCTHCKGISRNKFGFCPKCGATMQR